MAQNLSVYWGAFLNIPIPLELSLNYCSHNCTFCYANLNSPQRTADVSQIMGLLSSFWERETYAAKLLQMGYPVMCSTHVDFFAKSNEAIAMTLFEVMIEGGVNFAILTRGGDRYLEAVRMFPKPVVIYFSFVAFDDAIAARIEPNSPLPSERIRMIEETIALGHRVVAGINPCVPEWIGDPLPLLAKLQSIGVTGLLAQGLHLNNRQIDNMNGREIAAIGKTVLKRGKMRLRDKGMSSLLEFTLAAAHEMGLETYSIGQGLYSDYWKPYKDVYPVMFPILQDFVNYCWDSGKEEGDAIAYEEFRDFFVPKLPQGVFDLRNHLNATQNHKWSADWNSKIALRMTYERLLYWSWKVESIAYCPVNALTFRWAGYKDDSGWHKYVDSNDMPYLIFTPSATENYMMTEVDDNMVSIERESEASV